MNNIKITFKKLVTHLLVKVAHKIPFNLSPTETTCLAINARNLTLLMDIVVVKTQNNNIQLYQYVLRRRKKHSNLSKQ